MKKILNNWNTPRVMRLIAGIGFLTYALVMREYYMFILGFPFLIHAIIGNSVKKNNKTYNSSSYYKSRMKVYRPNRS